jgi:hypothetical protein
MKKYLFLLTFFSVLLVSCNTEVKIAGEWENLPVIYAILDPADTVHYLRVNRVFLGNQSGYEMALHADSLIYNETLDLKVNVFNAQNVLIRTLTFEKVPLLKDSVNQSGQVIFAVDKHHVYRSGQTLPSGKDFTYKLLLTFPDGKEVTSECHPLVEFEQSNPGIGQLYTLVPNRSFGPTYKLPKYSGAVKVNIYFHYYEWKSESDWVRKTIMIPIKMQRQSAGVLSSSTMKSNDVFARFKSELTPPESGVRRFIGKVDFEYVIADEYYTEQIFIRNSTINSETSPITNIVGGYGLFATRSYLLRKGFKPAENTKTAFYSDSELRLLGFPPALVYETSGINALP